MTLDHAEYKKRLLYSFDSFPDIHFSIQTAISDGDYVAITWLMTGTNLGKIGDFPPTNKPIKTLGTTIYYFVNNKVSGHYQVFDRTIVMKQLGYLKA
jgi:predicted ester cyclase